MAWSEEQINELATGSRDSLERNYRELKRLEYLQNDGSLSDLQQHANDLRNGIESNIEALKILKEQAIKEGNELVSSTISEAITELAKDLVAIPFKAIGTIAQVGEGLFDARMAEGKGETVEGLSDAAISALSSIPGISSLKTMFFDVDRDIEKFRAKYQNQVDAYVEHIKAMKKKLGDIQNQISQRQIPKADLIKAQEEILKKHPEFKQLDSEIQKSNSSATNRNTIASANVFTRINELLAQINASLQQLSANLEI